MKDGLFLTAALASLFTETIAASRMVRVFGSGHSRIIVEERRPRFGSFPGFHLINEIPNQMVVGMDMTRRSYWTGRGGKPGLAWLLTELPELLRQRRWSDEPLDNLLEHKAA